MPLDPAPVVRRRQHVSVTLHPQTLDRLDVLCGTFALPRGQVLDKLVVALSTAMETGFLTCVTGESCRVQRKDLPKVL
jgi:hypothetical protein